MPPTHRSRLEAVFLAASELPRANQEEFLARECAAAPEMISVVREMLAADRLTRENAAWSGPAWNSAMLWFGAYRVTGCLGSGGMGVVYSAVRDDDEFKKRVAIKTIPRALLTEPGARRLRLERQILAELEHPNIVRLLDGGTTEEGIPYVVMEYVEGQPITDYADSHGLNANGRLLLFRQVCAGVQFAHSNLVVHRDLKPANVLVGEDGTPKLLDFGIARLLDRLGEPTMTLTAMTPEYASPEQVKGAPITTASDVYSLGVLLFQLLSGSLPYRNTNTAMELADAICSQQPEFSRDTARQISRDLQNIVLKALRKEPHRRYQSADDFSEDIRRHLEGFPVGASAGTFWYRASKFLVRNRLTVTAGVVAAFTVLVGFVATTQQRLRAEKGEATNRHLLYDARMSLAFPAWETADVGRTLDLLAAQRPKRGEEDLRGFEWYLLWQLTHVASRVLPGPAERVKSAGFSRDGRRLAAASLDGTAHIWDAATGNLIRSLKLNGPEIALTPDGKFLVAGADGGSLKLWAADTGEFVRAFDGHEGGILSVAFSPDNRTFATAGSDGTAKVWKVNDRRPALVLRGHRGAIDSVTFSPDGRLLATAGSDHTTKLWDVSSGKEAATLRGHSWTVFTTSFSPDGAMLATSGSDGEVKLWDVASHREIAAIHANGTSIQTMDFSPDSRKLAVGGWNGLVSIYDVASRELSDTLRAHTESVTTVAFSPDGKRLVSGARDRTVRLWDLTGNSGAVTLEGHQDWIWDMKFSPDGRTLATASKDATVKLWNVSGGGAPHANTMMTLHHPQWVNGLAFSPDGSKLATADDDTIVRVWNRATGQLLESLSGHSAVAECVAFSPGGGILASGSKNGEIELWNPAVGKRLASLRSPDANLIWELAFSPDGKYLAAAEGGFDDLALAAGHLVTVWEVSTQRIVAVLRGHTRDVRAIAFSPDGSVLASGSYDGTIKFWELATLQEIATLKTQKVHALAFSSDGKRLVSGGRDKTVRLWDVATRQEVGSLGGSSEINSLAFSPNNRILAAGSSDGKVRLWLAAAKD